MTLHQRVAISCVALTAGALVACENRQAFRRPEPGLERMLSQPRGKPYRESPEFDDGRMMRTPPPNTLRREAEHAGDLLIERGRTANGYALRVPMRLTRDVLRHGRVLFDDVCATCHGVRADGTSFVAEKMELRKPPSLFEPRIAALEPGRIFEIISEGYGLMPSFGAMLGVDDHWAVVGYLGVLKMSQTAKLAELPEDVRSHFSEGQP